MKKDFKDSDTVRNASIAFALALVTILAVLVLTGLDSSDVYIVKLESGETNHTVAAEAAITEEEKRQGLMHREYLGEDEGMIFIYEEEDERSFWMKNTLLHLDIIFIGEDQVINSIQEADPEPGISDTQLERYTGDAKYVLEVNQGFTEERGIVSGDRVFLEQIE